MSNEATMSVYDPSESDYELHCADARLERDFYLNEADEECAAAEVSLTIIPATYPELEAETYASLDFVTERPTLVPSAEEQLGLEVDCLLGDRDPVEIEVDAMFWEQNEAAITAADMREGLSFRLSQRDE